MRKGQEYKRKDRTKESLNLEAKTDVDKTLLAALTDEDSGILKSGLLPKVDCTNPAGAKNLLNAISQAGNHMVCLGSRVCVCVWEILVYHLHMECQILELDLNHPTWNFSYLNLNLNWITTIGTSVTWNWITTLGSSVSWTWVKLEISTHQFCHSLSGRCTKKKDKRKQRDRKGCP